MNNSKIALTIFLLSCASLYAGKGKGFSRRTLRALKLESAEVVEEEEASPVPGLDFESQSWGTPEGYDGDWAKRAKEAHQQKKEEEAKQFFKEKCEKIYLLRQLLREEIRKSFEELQNSDDFGLVSLFNEK